MGLKEKIGRVGVLMSGPSTEKKISLKSGQAVCAALKKAGFNVVPVLIKTDKTKDNIRLLKLKKIDCAFIALHGRFGEDGGIQKILHSLKIPYTGSGVRASCLAMDKTSSRKIFQKYGLKVPRSWVFSRDTYQGFYCAKLGLPLVVKPATHGSSIGLSIVGKLKDIPAAIELAFKFDEKIIIEEYIKGRELTVGILEERAMPVIEIVPRRAFFDFQAKYQKGLTRYVVPAKLSPGLTRSVKKAALSAHKLLGCTGCSRVDIILDEKNTPFILEVNTIPGLTATSLLPKAAKKSGISFTALCLKLIKLAYEKKKN
ncbi:MAG: D-alanine--D-alanine ligase [Candidatus Omnitrophica bacterium]|nr:D-alanine--D-alanine ligase [Candidatus Omnitrophota bacterium]MDD5026896.1 D-alanine--D-alanine ligase [Candidatus Omnitrophota bacterium]MDD5662172.1 D-alanine--D-alanine ligase [Candidatus Omnitrophota bacterium]